MAKGMVCCRGTAQRGCAYQLLNLPKAQLKADEEVSEDAFGNSSQSGSNIDEPSRGGKYQLEPIGTPRIPPMPNSVPLSNFLHVRSKASSTRTMYASAIPPPSAYSGNLQYQSIDLSLAGTDTIITATANIGINTATTDLHKQPMLTTGIKRSSSSVLDPNRAARINSNIDSIGSINDLQLSRNRLDNPRSLFTAAVRQNRQCAGPALGVPVGKIPTNPWFAPKCMDQRKLLMGIITGEYRMGVLKSKDGRIIKRKKGFVSLQPDRLRWRCGACCLKHPKKYNRWDGWTGHKIHQVGILDCFTGYFNMVCPDCGGNPLRVKHLDNCQDAIITCARHWKDVNQGTIMEVVPLRQVCLCSLPLAGDFQDPKTGTKWRPIFL
ncbi:hypothetical protein QAD02_021606 [Eretmocerus hayati]|uniref:Uncharacterized protein n=1 Tax=Eretmocerus hayati TaxID=131215 RepID=A0ACC2PS36_9HYME|nr:hypothetical protein QAD02_021606 [Eretmocerus hayati]